MNRYPLWKYLLVLAILVVGAIYALPNVYGQAAAVQVSMSNGDLPDGIEHRVQDILDQNGLHAESMRRSQGTLLALFGDDGAQRKARGAIKDALGDQYVVALNLASAAPAWLRDLGGRPLNLGLDLRGGVHFLLEVDMKAALKASLEQKAGDIRRYLREQDIRYRGVTLEDQRIRVRFADAGERDKAVDALDGRYRDLNFDTEEGGSNPALVAQMTQKAAQDERDQALEQNITTLRNRVNELGIAEPVVQRQGQSRIVVQLPGVQDTTRAKEILGATATLEFRLVHGTPGDWQQAEQSGDVPYDARLYHRRNGQPVLLQRDVIVTGDQIEDAAASFDNRTGTPVVVVNLDSAGANHMQEVTAQHVGDQMAVVYIENKVHTKKINGKEVKERSRTEQVINVATIRDVLSHRFQIEGLVGGELGRYRRIHALPGYRHRRLPPSRLEYVCSIYRTAAAAAQRRRPRRPGMVRGRYARRRPAAGTPCRRISGSCRR